MTVMVELERKVEEAQEKLSSALTELAAFSDLRKGLELAGTNLSSAATAVTELSETVERHTKYLSGAASALSEAVDVLKKTDFGELRHGLSSLHAAVREGNEALGTHVKRTGENLANEIRQVSGSTAVEIKKSVNPAISDLAEKLKNNSIITWVLIAVSISTSAYSVILK